MNWCVKNWVNQLNNKDLIPDGMIYVKIICKLMKEWINEWQMYKLTNEWTNE